MWNKISIIIPCYKEKNEKILFIILDLTNKFSNIEIIISDWSYNLDIKKSLEVFPNVKYLNNSKKTRSSWMNLWANTATWDIFLFLHCDTILPEEMKGVLENVDLEKYNYWGFYKKFDKNSFWLTLNSFLTNLKLRYFWSLLWDNSIFISKELFSKIWWFSNISLMEDVNISKKLKKNWKIRIIKYFNITSSRKFSNSWFIKTIIFMQYMRILYLLWTNPDILNKKYLNFWKK